MAVWIHFLKGSSAQHMEQLCVAMEESSMYLPLFASFTQT